MREEHSTYAVQLIMSRWLHWVPPVVMTSSSPTPPWVRSYTGQTPHRLAVDAQQPYAHMAVGGRELAVHHQCTGLRAVRTCGSSRRCRTGRPARAGGERYWVYLVQFDVVYALDFTSTQFFRYGPLSAAVNVVGNLVFAVAAAVALHLLVEMPAAALERELFRRGKVAA